MNKKEIGRLYATAFDKPTYEFIVYNNATMDCPMLNATSIYRLIIKSRFELFSKNCSYINPAKQGEIDGLIKDYNIEDNLFKYLKSNNMIMYSTDMAYLYGF